MVKWDTLMTMPWRKDKGREHTAFKSDREVRNKTGSVGVVCYRPKTNPRNTQRFMAEIRSELENHEPFNVVTLFSSQLV